MHKLKRDGCEMHFHLLSNFTQNKLITHWPLRCVAILFPFLRYTEEGPTLMLIQRQIQASEMLYKELTVLN